MDEPEINEPEITPKLKRQVIDRLLPIANGVAKAKFLLEKCQDRAGDQDAVLTELQNAILTELQNQKAALAVLLNLLGGRFLGDDEGMGLQPPKPPRQ